LKSFYIIIGVYSLDSNGNAITKVTPKGITYVLKDLSFIQKLRL